MNEPTRLLVIWRSADREVALHNVFMYTHNAQKQGWWEEVRLLIWGPSDKLLAEDKELQERLKAMKADGVDITACKACADIYGVSEKLEGLGVNVFYVGQALTEMLKEGRFTQKIAPTRPARRESGSCVAYCRQRRTQTSGGNEGRRSMFRRFACCHA